MVISGSEHNEGVSMYDGETFTHFTQKEGLSNNAVHSILEDSHGNLWFGTWGWRSEVCIMEVHLRILLKKRD